MDGRSWRERAERVDLSPGSPGPSSWRDTLRRDRASCAETARGGHNLEDIGCQVEMKARWWLEIVGTVAGLEQVRGRDAENRVEWP